MKPPFLYEGTSQKGYFLTIQSTLDLIKDCKETATTGFDGISFVNSSIFHTNNDLKQINSTLVKYPSAFTQNPFFWLFSSSIGNICC